MLSEPGSAGSLSWSEKRESCSWISRHGENKNGWSGESHEIDDEETAVKNGSQGVPPMQYIVIAHRFLPCGERRGMSVWTTSIQTLQIHPILRSIVISWTRRDYAVHPDAQELGHRVYATLDKKEIWRMNRYGSKQTYGKLLRLRFSINSRILHDSYMKTKMFYCLEYMDSTIKTCIIVSNFRNIWKLICFIAFLKKPYNVRA